MMVQGTGKQNVSVEGRIVAFLDIGTNSIRILIVRVFSNCTYTILSRQKETVRLGEGEFAADLILEEAMDRAIAVCRNFIELARSFATEEFVAVATSAAREARNRNIFLSRLRHEAGLDVRVVSGREEARLIYLGVVTSVHLGEQQAIFIDIGGGSTEVVVGSQHGSSLVESLPLGSIRLTNIFFPKGEEGTVSREQYRRIRNHIRERIEPVIPEFRGQRIDIAIGSSGTIINLAEIASKTFGGKRSAGELSQNDLRKVIGQLCSLPLAERRKVPGINPDRADIIICGAAILDVLMDELSLTRIETTSRGLQDGLLADYLTRMADFPLIGRLTVRERSVLQLARSCGINEYHARTVTRLAQDLFRSGQAMGLHPYSDAEEELLLAATFLHDVGSFISYTNHHLHSFYLIRNSELVGFTDREILIMANLARYHRKKFPKKKVLGQLLLEKHDLDLLEVLAVFLRMAESLDRSHAGLVRHARFTSVVGAEAKLEITAVGECQLELSGLENEMDTFSRIFGKTLIPMVVTADVRDIHERPAGDALPGIFSG
jgi:exopolyphosphatase/guanosine-5'-triphosphate,3'-diphosphate pyrophosphatase